MNTVAELLKQHDTVTIVSHIHPDGDAVGSVLGLQLGLEQLGKKVNALLKDPVPTAFSYLPNGDSVLGSTFPQKPGLCIVVDLGDASRTGFPEEILKSARLGNLITIDHHPKGDLSHLSAAVVHEESASSTCEIVYELLTALGVRITPPIATAVLTGIYTDTGGFQYPNTTTKTLEIASELMRRGARLNTITHHVSRTKSIAALKLLGIALERLRLTHDNQCAVSVLNHQDIIGANAQAEDVSGIIGEMNVLPEVKISLLLTEIEAGTIRGTLRTGEGHKTKVNILAKLLGGGGHPRAAGFMVPGTIVINPDTQEWLIKTE